MPRTPALTCPSEVCEVVMRRGKPARREPRPGPSHQPSVRMRSDIVYIRFGQEIQERGY